MTRGGDAGTARHIPARETATSRHEPAGSHSVGMPSRATAAGPAVPPPAPGRAVCAGLLPCRVIGRTRLAHC